MDQIKIGKFIAELRKGKNMTQQQLAEKLGVSYKTISKWETGRGMPELSTIKPLSEELDVSINELLSGEKVEKQHYQQKLEENILNTINYTNKKITKDNNLIGLILVIFGILISAMAMTTLPSESSWGGIYSILGGIISMIGISKFTKKFTFGERLICNLGYFILFIIMLFVIDYIGVVNIEQAPRFSLIKETGDNMVIYKTPFYNVYRINLNTKNEYYIVDAKKEYTEDTVPNVPFNRKKSGINNIIQYKNKYIGNNSNTGNLINNLPLSEYGYVFEIDSVNLGLTIDYHITDWYINQNSYLEKSLIYNSLSIFSLIDNLEYIKFNFSGKTYYITKKQIEQLYPNYKEIINNGIDKNNFNNYVENKIIDDEFIDKIFNSLFE